MPTNNSMPSPSDQRTECEQDPVGSIGTQLSFLLEKPLKELVETIVAKNPGKVNQDDEGEALFDQIQRSLNRIWKKMRGTILRVVRDSNILRRAGVTDETRASIILASKIASVTDHSIQCPVDWKAPMQEPEMKSLKQQTMQSEKEIASVLEAARGVAQRGKGITPTPLEAPQKGESDTSTRKPTPFSPTEAKLAEADKRLKAQLKSQMVRYGERLSEVAAKGFECTVILPAVYNSLMPQYRDVYHATGKLVQQDRAFAQFNLVASNVSSAATDNLQSSARVPSIGADGKPRQPVKTVVELLHLSCKSKQPFDDAMQRIADKLRDVEWCAAPLKKCARVVEKLCLDRGQPAGALASQDPDRLDASGMLDTVRGMLLCLHMGGCTECMRLVMEMFRVLRVKNRFATPSDGGWMDALVNILVPVGDTYIIAEVQIVHKQLYTVRKQLGAHTSYAIYRAAIEFLECTENMGLISDPEGYVAAQLEHVGCGVVQWHRCLQLLAPPGGRDGRQQRVGWRGVRVMEVHDVEALETAVKVDAFLMPRLLSEVVEAVAPESQHARVARCWESCGQPVPRTVPGVRLSGHSKAVSSVCFSPDGKLVASGSGDNTVRITSVGDGTLVQEVKGHSSLVSSVCFSPDGKLVASGSYDETVRITSVGDGTLVQELKGHSDTVTGVCFSPDGKLVTSGSYDKTVRITSVGDGTLVQEVKGHSAEVTSVCFSPDGKLVASGSEDKTV